MSQSLEPPARYPSTCPSLSSTSVKKLKSQVAAAAAMKKERENMASTIQALSGAGTDLAADRLSSCDSAGHMQGSEAEPPADCSSPQHAFHLFGLSVCNQTGEGLVTVRRVGAAQGLSSCCAVLRSTVTRCPSRLPHKPSAGDCRVSCCDIPPPKKFNSHGRRFDTKTQGQSKSTRRPCSAVSDVAFASDCCSLLF